LFSGGETETDVGGFPPIEGIPGIETPTEPGGGEADGGGLPFASLEPITLLFAWFPLEPCRPEGFPEAPARA
jgi:hypothetical protein